MRWRASATRTYAGEDGCERLQRATLAVRQQRHDTHAVILPAGQRVVALAVRAGFAHARKYICVAQPVVPVVAEVGPGVNAGVDELSEPLRITAAVICCASSTMTPMLKWDTLHCTAQLAHHLMRERARAVSQRTCKHAAQGLRSGDDVRVLICVHSTDSRNASPLSRCAA